MPWFYNYSDTGQITVSERFMFGIPVTGATAPPYATYLFCLVLVVILGFAAKNLIRSKTGRSWMAIRDMDIAAEIIGVPPLKTKLSAFAISSFYIGVAGALYFAVFLGAIEVTESFDIMTISFPVLFSAALLFFNSNQLTKINNVDYSLEISIVEFGLNKPIKFLATHRLHFLNE